MNILITGASGYIGYNLSKYLLQNKNYKIFGLDIENNDIKAENYFFYNIDLTKENLINILPKDIEVIIHLSQSKNYRNFPAEAKDIFEVNTNSTFKLLEWGRLNNIKKFIFASTGNIYKQKKDLLIESDQCEPIDFYGTTKYCSELLSKSYSNFFNVIILRIFGVYGPGQKGMLIPNLIEKIKQQQTVILAQNKGLLITPIYVSDVVEFIEILLLNQIGNLEIINVAGNEILSYKDMTEIIAEELNIKPNFVVNNNEPTYLIADNKKMLLYFQKEELVRFKDGIKNVLKYY